MRKKKKKDTYHHGNLRECCIKEGLKILSKVGPSGLSLREIARKLGVSHGAPYNHFSNRNDLMAAIAEEGFKTFTNYLKLEDEPADLPPLERFLKMGHAFLKFAQEHPDSFRLMFTKVIPDHLEYEELKCAGEDSFAVLLNAVQAMQNEGILKEDAPIEMCIHIWSTLHGYASLILDDRFEFLELNSDSYEKLLDQISLNMLSGILSPDYQMKLPKGVV